MKYLNIDNWINKNETFWKALEIHCMVECCGIDAFAFDKETILSKTLQHDVLDIKNNIEAIIKEINISKFDKISSGFFNLYEDKEVFGKRMTEILLLLE
ncbi:DUF6331 family protein [Winogradskyella endarachnes]|uniref:Uncharacterized protein n=1 Tax=Winogradskyella endarachnes TaxID=2681965 RepID=A0A6L6UA40_9FLAO|nr:DUF6331 family protein [Winogradskyella endarachnes]MUU79175.1 hypothetical protein [Winogradskyella endarachnes]